MNSEQNLKLESPDSDRVYIHLFSLYITNITSKHSFHVFHIVWSENIFHQKNLLFINIYYSSKILIKSKIWGYYSLPFLKGFRPGI